MRNDFLGYVAELRGWLDWAPAPLASTLVLVLAGLLALLASRLLVNLFLRIPGSRRAFFRSFAKEVRRPLRVLVVVVAVGAALPAAGLSYDAAVLIGQVLLFVFVLLVGWAASLALRICAELYLERFKTGGEDDLQARKHVTQIRILKRAADLLVFVVTVSAALMTFGPVRQYGLSLFASAGAASLVVGLAARPLLTNLIAGVQIAMTQPIRLEDAVIVEGEWGWIEEITSTYVVVRLWDWRRMILPIAYFLEKPFQNWTHQSASLIGTVMFYLDYRVPVELLRARLDEIVTQTPLWDGKVVNLQVSDVKESTVEIRMLVSGRNAPQTWDLRCFVREKMLAFLQDACPDALPRTRLRLDQPQREAAAGAGAATPPPSCRGAASGLGRRHLRLGTLLLRQRLLRAARLAPAILRLAVRMMTALVMLLLGLALLRRLRDRVQDAEIMLRVLEVAFRHHPVAGTGGVAAQLQVLLEQLLRGAADAEVRTVAVEHVVAVERDLAVVVTDRRAAAATAAATWTMVPAAHAFHVHQLVTALS